MAGNKPAIYSDLVKVDATTDDEIARQIADDADTAPELADDWFDKADLHYGETLLRRGRGRPQLEAPKERLTHLGGKPNFEAAATETRAVIGRTSWYADGKPALEIHAPKARAKNLPINENGRVNVDLKIGNGRWSAKLHMTKNCPYVWISPTLINSDGHRCRLVDALVDFRPNDRVILKTEGREVEVVREEVAAQ